VERDLIYAEPLGVMRLIDNLTNKKPKAPKVVVEMGEKQSGLALVLSALDEMQQAQIGGMGYLGKN